MIESIDQAMSSVIEEPMEDVGVSELPPAKRRRGGRRSANPNISAEERKRLRVLKNRESAMRSLAKKAAYSSKLENTDKVTIEEHKTSREDLEKLINTAIAMRTALGKVPEDLEKLATDAEAAINKATTALAEDAETQDLSQHDLQYDPNLQSQSDTPYHSDQGQTTGQNQSLLQHETTSQVQLNALDQPEGQTESDHQTQEVDTPPEPSENGAQADALTIPG